MCFRLAQRRPDGFQRLIRPLPIRPAGLREIGPPAAAFAANSGGRQAQVVHRCCQMSFVLSPLVTSYPAPVTMAAADARNTAAGEI